jgi:hypothetical protein
MTSDKARELKKFLINSSVSPSAMRKQGKSLINPIRNKLIEIVSFDVFFIHLFAEDENYYSDYLNYLTNEIEGLPGIDDDGNFTGNKVQWGTARKCINLVLRSIVYDGHIWEDYAINDAMFTTTSNLRKLELPLDGNVIEGLQERLINHPEYIPSLFKNFAIIHLTPASSNLLQNQARILSESLNICKIDLDLILWRPEPENNQPPLRYEF